MLFTVLGVKNLLHDRVEMEERNAEVSRCGISCILMTLLRMVLEVIDRDPNENVGIYAKSLKTF
jgi:hypothetical protein